MLAKVISCAVVGLEGTIVEVEVDISPGLPSFTIVGLPDAGGSEDQPPCGEIRAGQRRSNQPVTGTALAEGLLFYSQRREDYVVEVKDMIRRNQSYFPEHGKAPQS